MAAFVRRNALGIAVAYFLLAPVVASLLTPGSDLIGLSVVLLALWIAGFPLFLLLRRFARSN